MSTEAITLYDILIEKGIDKKRAREAVDAFVTKEYAKDVLATKDDIRDVVDRVDSVKDEIRNNLKWMAGMLVAQAAAIVALIELVSRA